MPSPLHHALRTATESVGLIWAATRRWRQSQDDRLQFTTTIRVRSTETPAGLSLMFDEPDRAATVRHSAAIQHSASQIERLVGQAVLADGHITRAGFSLTLRDRLDDRIRLAALAADRPAIRVGHALLAALCFEGWVDHADETLDYRPCGAMSGRLVLTGGRHTDRWSLSFVGDYTAARRAGAPMQPTLTAVRPTTAA